ncbi:Fe(3+) ABC transporter substrate-binding protein [Cocleimonas sp. KMM 6892]|uniref:Fe(3+) ABC transporter substrate-binding protein n=1 Tax=unclassified Cocleimonas TaxID=2639732 RepID=UPI002DBF7402|nr:MULTISPECIES: Fe(3+) ABC transporter substrate-binding protein [unclassified Cocleimonas]MEB8431000.1 Fe(3+) ABC transporter substrate-binding protein [Cocleimonas sp. KMM 6892]MEC4714228.1 Fe(3+) ABC transporter substrate-binding protein [Cocleimonas sp. KMM 6895]MEC4743559.1 Fe(3+) ABC transporter substrate-binding protein [Cocleimonas sp. KMM 6896]
MRVLVILFFVLAAGQVSANNENVVNIYSSRQSQLIQPVLKAFTKDTGIKVNLITGKDDALIERIRREGPNTQADILLTADAGRLSRAKQAKILQPVKSSILFRSIPANLRDPENTWFGLTYRSRVIFYKKSTINPNQLSTYEDLADPKWKGRICVRSSDSIYNQSLVASMIAAKGMPFAEKWVKGLVSNFSRKPQGGDRDQIKAVASGACDIAIANTYYYAQMLFGGDKRQKGAAEQVGIFWPNQNDRGAHINISGAGVTAAAKHKANAIKLLEYMLEDVVQGWYSTVNGEYPVKPGVPADTRLQKWGKFKTDALNLSSLGRFNAQAVQAMDKGRWR